jgi:hypothetical protein
MSSYSKKCLISVAVMHTCLLGTARPGVSQSAGSDPFITVCIYNQALVSKLTLNRARELTITLFRQAGIKAVWLDCSRYMSNSQSAACRSGIGPAYLSLRITPGPVSTQAGFSKSTTGFATLTAHEKGIDASVFFRRVDEIAEKHNIPNYRILGIAMAHEIGHLLLGSNSHSRTGIMRPHWDRQDLVPGGRFLGFTAEEATVMHADVSARMKQQAVFEASGLDLPK